MNSVSGAMAASTLRVDKARMAALVGQGGGWTDTHLAVPAGDATFRVGAMAPGLSVTRSTCRLRSPLRSTVEHDGATAILAFGLQGGSVFGVSHREPRHVVQAGDVWLFQAQDAVMMRHTPAQSCAVMAALKVDLSRIGAALEDLDVPAAQGAGAWRLATGAGGGHLLADLLASPLVSPVERLQAESAALSLLAHWLTPFQAGVEVPAGVLSPGDRRAVLRVVEALTETITDPPSLEALAALAGMSHVRLNRCFRKLWGKTVFAWLREHRLEVAARRIGEGRHSVTDIAFLCGFSSSSHFAAAFRARFGCAPVEYRRRVVS